MLTVLTEVQTPRFMSSGISHHLFFWSDPNAPECPATKLVLDIAPPRKDAARCKHLLHRVNKLSNSIEDTKRRDFSDKARRGSSSADFDSLFDRGDAGPSLFSASPRF
jgi:hypothetical protein